MLWLRTILAWSLETTDQIKYRTAKVSGAYLFGIRLLFQTL